MPEVLLTLAWLSVLVGAYGARARTLARRDAAVPTMRMACFAAGVGVLGVALLPPFADFAEGDLFVAHMAQHLLLVDLAPPLLLAGLTGPLLRPVLAALPARALRRITNCVALPVAFALLVGWHVPLLFDAAVRQEPVHVLEHVSLVAAGMLCGSRCSRRFPPRRGSAPARSSGTCFCGASARRRSATSCSGRRCRSTPCTRASTASTPSGTSGSPLR